MVNNKKTAPELAFRDGGETMHGAISIPDIHFNIFGGGGQAPVCVWPLLGVGVDNAVSRAMLASMLGTSERDIRRLVNRERRAGLPICSDVEAAGYFRPATLADVERVERSMRHRARETAVVADALRRSLDEMSGQERIEEVVGNE